MKKTDKFQWLPKYKKKLIYISLISIVISIIATLIHGFKIYIILFVILSSVITYWICYGIALLLLSIQVLNPLCPKGLLKFFCYFFMYPSVVAYILSLIMPIVYLFINSNTPEEAINGSLGSLGFMLGAYKVYTQYVLNGKNHHDPEKKGMEWTA